ncbi:unnamed protein product [Strongylus vulgaris]|uniref:Uncharacterized protein n=1 Tax=Strongylus vulgaris TaxID=40348 RepID=A0A3P7L549_STRVU|nr:unnamed protein product [Strongylus vulgaris]
MSKKKKKVDPLASEEEIQELHDVSSGIQPQRINHFIPSLMPGFYDWIW